MMSLTPDSKTEIRSFIKAGEKELRSMQKPWPRTLTGAQGFSLGLLTKAASSPDSLQSLSKVMSGLSRFFTVLVKGLSQKTCSVRLNIDKHTGSVAWSSVCLWSQLLGRGQEGWDLGTHLCPGVWKPEQHNKTLSKSKQNKIKMNNKNYHKKDEKNLQPHPQTHIGANRALLVKLSQKQGL